MDVNKIKAKREKMKPLKNVKTWVLIAFFGIGSVASASAYTWAPPADVLITEPGKDGRVWGFFSGTKPSESVEPQCEVAHRYVLQASDAGFAAMYSSILLALATGKKVQTLSTGCDGGYNVLRNIAVLDSRAQHL